MAWTRIAAASLLLLAAAPVQALFDPGNVGLPTGHPGVFEPGEPPVIPPPPEFPPLGLYGIGHEWIEVVVRAPIGRTSQLSRQAPGASYAPMRSFTAGSETVLRDANLRVGQKYCYRLDVTGGGKADESHTRCATTDWRVGFEGLAISTAEGSEVLRTFDWRDTQALPEGVPDEPALYHMNLLIEGGDPNAENGFRTLGMHVQASPIFPEELEVWSATQTLAQDCGLAPIVAEPLVQARAFGPVHGGSLFGGCTVVGRWFYAAVPGRIYNELRVRMLEQIGNGEAPGIRALVFRRVPVAAALAPSVSRHVLNYTYLGEQGFEYNGIPRCYLDANGTEICETYLLGWVVRKVVGWVVEIGDEAIEGVRRAIGRVRRLVKGEVTLELQFRLLNTDPAFGTYEVMRSGWSGEEIKLAGVTVEVRQGLAAFVGKADANGYVKLTVAKDSNTKVCIELENEAVEITEFLIETTLCVRSLGKLDGDRYEVVDVRNDYANALASMTDAREYMRVVAGVSLDKVTVLVGGNAMLLTPNGRSFSPCMGQFPSLAGVAADGAGLLLALINPGFLLWTTMAEFLTSVDIVLAPGDDGSRGVPVHEYGHAVMCDLIFDQGPDAFELAWTDVILQSATQDADDQASYLAEGFADFLTGQILGGTNYFPTPGSVKADGVDYCPAGASCLEENYDASDTSALGSDGTTDFRAQVRRIATLLHDGFDGQAGTDAANDATHWQTAAGSPYVQLTAHDSDRGDEVVVLAASDISTLFEHWDERGTLLREDNFLGGLADLAEARGFAEADVCALFALHDAGATCPGYVARRPWLDWGVAAESGGLLQAFAFAPAPTTPGGVPAPYPNAASLRAFVAAIAASAPAPEPGTEPELGEETDECADCSRVVVFEGVQKVAVQKAGKSEREATFAFRLGANAFEGIDPLGQLYTGAWDSRDARGAKLRLHLAPEAVGNLEALLAASAADLGVERGAIRTSGPAKIELRLAKGGSLVGKVVVHFEVELDGRTRRGSYVAKLRSEEV